MTGKFLIAATVAAGFWRCGRHFTESGILVDAADFTDEEWERLKAEVKLRIKEASDDDAAAIKERLEKIAEAVSAFSAEDFQRDGKPKLDSLNALLSDELGKITGAERDRVWVAMTENGFKAPTASS
ncbi:hypothetical protein GTA62_13040 [Roseobacter sp. HKCCD9010]|uniref:hypothetical protein n=1 Tax=unclassified Roseobacter TaxID=196798 RepID=UPI0014924AA7|nr:MULTISPECIES: hypothetical protein [unclassified Roseobacter]MBF9049891.1 hypothetical protein [Rhodobacterales bacterium HKCCD4356]NNV13570.1 hypothetical protein [Roseobacter sp. HKCCD7357]NNV16404.1 hypothetical protein [Roseobacter sp. HKCCD8768]NNV25863.1 hypothetical protein [Roseobacter sp. HKCCD8192]NNV30121.1 hypothetical protein [Roseobacter sp. HKCCD9061]